MFVSINALAYTNFTTRLINRTKKRITLNMIPVAMTQQKEQGFIVLHHAVAQFTNTGTRIKN